MQIKNIDIFSFFSGAGFLDLGFEKNSYNVVYVNEYNEDFLNVYKFARKQMHLRKPKYGYYCGGIDDFLSEKKEELINLIDKSRQNGLVGFIGGPPCPDFSIAGKNKGVDGKNGKLTISYKNLILQFKPDFFVFENVKGLWSTKKHRLEYENIKNELENQGYVLIDRLNNALEYGVPQDRERVFLIGFNFKLINKDYATAQKLLLHEFDWGLKYFLKNIHSIAWPTTDTYLTDGEIICPNNIIKELTVEYWFRKNDVYNHYNANDYFIPHSIDRFKTIKEGDVSKKSFKRLHRWRYSPTVAYGNNEVHLHPYKARRLSAAESLALQSLPKSFVISKELTKSNMFKTIGNGVPYLMSKKIAQKIKEFLTKV